MVTFPAAGPATQTGLETWGSFSTGYVCVGGYQGVSGTPTVVLPPLTAFARDPDTPTRLAGFAEPGARAVTYSSGDGTYWLAGRCSPAYTPPGWTGVPGTHYCWLKSATRPPVPAGAVLLSQATVAGGALTATVDYACRRITGTAVLSQPRSVHSSALWYVEPGGVLQVPTGGTFTFGGQLVAGRYPIFDRSGGTFTFARGVTVFPEWWGAVADDPNVDSAPAIQTALSLRHQMVCDCAMGVYTLGSGIVLPHLQGWILQGQGKLVTTFRRAPSYVGALLTIGSFGGSVTTADVQIVDLGFDGLDRAAGVIGIDASQMTRSKYSRLHFVQCDVGLREHFTVTQLYELLTFEQNRLGYQVVNPGQGATMHTWIGGRFSANQECGHSIDGTHGPGLIRRLTFYGTVFEANDALVPAGTNIGLSIKRAFAIQCINCWFEGNATHVYLNNAGAEASNPMRYIEFRHCQFSPRNVNAVSPTSFLWEDGIPGDGQGSLLDNCFLRDGVYQFNQRVVVPVIGSTLNPMASLAGNFVKDDFINRSRVRARDPAQVGPWAPERLAREFPGYAVDFSQSYVGETTTTDVYQAIEIYDLDDLLPNDGALTIWVYLTATQAGNVAHAVYSYVGMFKRVAGVTTPIDPSGSPVLKQDLHPPMEYGGEAAAWDATFIVDPATQEVKVVVKGSAGVTVYWSGSLRHTRTMFPLVGADPTPAWETVGEWRSLP